VGRMLFFHQQGEIQSGRSTANNTNPHVVKAPALKGSLIAVMPSPVGDKRRRDIMTSDGGRLTPDVTRVRLRQISPT
jgi:hypothetical protein